jgi:[protein-PII] uridylyltransferase
VGPAFAQGLPTRYLRTRTPEQLQEHAKLQEVYRQKGVAISLTRRNSLHELVVLASDRPFLFASIAGTVSSFAMNILRAEAFSNKEGMVLDTFAFADPNRSLELNQGETDRLRQTLEQVLMGKIDVRELLQKRPPPSTWRRPHISRQITFDNETSPHSTLIHVITEDREGLLYDLASTVSFQGCNIDVVLIDTEGHKAIDVFYVQSGGGKLSDDKARELCGELERACEGERD